MPFFVKFVIIRYVRLWHDTQNFALIKHRRAVVKP